MSPFSFQLIHIALIIVAMATVQSLPIRRVATTSPPTAADSTVKMSRVTADYLINKKKNLSLHTLWLKAKCLAPEDLLKAKVREHARMRIYAHVNLHYYYYIVSKLGTQSVQGPSI